MSDESSTTSSSEEQAFAFEQQDRQSPGVPELHRQIIEEQLEPHEGNERVPLWVFFCFLALAMWGGWYIGEHDGGFLSSVYDGPDAFRRVDFSQPGASKKAIDPEKLGKRVFNTCLTCHQADGEGVPEKYPPLNKSEWVLGDDRILARILINGLAGPVEVCGKKFDSQMPPWKQLSDYDIAAVLTYIRSSWDNDAPPVAPSTISEVRAELASRDTQFQAKELQSLSLPDAPELSASKILEQYNNVEIKEEFEVQDWMMLKHDKEEFVVKWVMENPGDVISGSQLFTSTTCATCHMGSEGVKAIGPPLTDLSKRLKRDKIIESILHPSKEIVKGFEGYMILDFEGKVFTGAIVEEDDTVLKLQPAEGDIVEILIDDIEERAVSKTSPMPVGLVDQLSVQQLADLVAYLESL